MTSTTKRYHVSNIDTFITDNYQFKLRILLKKLYTSIFLKKKVFTIVLPKYYELSDKEDTTLTTTNNEQLYIVKVKQEDTVNVVKVVLSKYLPLNSTFNLVIDSLISLILLSCFYIIIVVVLQ